MGAPVPNTNAVEDATAETLLNSLRTIEPGERRKHASVYNYWLSIRTDREFPPIRDLDPLEISEAGPFSVLLEMIGGGEDAEIRHFGKAIRGGIDADKISDAPNPSLLTCIAKRLPVVAATRDAFAFEDQFETADGKMRCWVTLLPFSATGTWIDYVYGFVSLAFGAGTVATPAEPIAESEPVGDLAEVLKLADSLAEADQSAPDSETFEAAPPTAIEETVDPPLEPAEPERDSAAAEQASPAIKPTFSSRFFETLANVGGFYGRPVEIELDPETASLESWEADEPASSDSASVDEAPAEESLSADESADEMRSEERRVGKECRSRWSPYH